MSEVFGGGSNEAWNAEAEAYNREASILKSGGFMREHKFRSPEPGETGLITRISTRKRDPEEAVGGPPTTWFKHGEAGLPNGS